MNYILGPRGTGKTRLLVKQAAEELNSVIVCEYPQCMLEKIHAYGYSGISVMSYEDFIKTNTFDKKYFIDDIDVLLAKYNIRGYTKTLEERGI